MHIYTSKKLSKTARKAAINLYIFRFCQLMLKNYFHWTFFVNFENRFSRFISWSHQINLCIITGKGRSVYKTFRMTRNVVHKKGMLGLLNGLAKSSW